MIDGCGIPSHELWQIMDAASGVKILFGAAIPGEAFDLGDRLTVLLRYTITMKLNLKLRQQTVSLN